MKISSDKYFLCRTIVAPLLKSFQNEIDSLSKRSKAAEKAFFDIYKKFFDISDPVPTLEYCMESLKSLQKLQDLEIENAQLRETLGDCNIEITDYKEKLKQLKDIEEKFNSQESKMEELIAEKIKKKEEDLQTMFDEKSKVVEEEKQRNAVKLSEAEVKLKQMQQLLDESQNELFELKTRQDHQSNAKTEEVELILNDLDRANQRAVAAEREVIVVREQLEEMKTSKPVTDEVDITEDQTLELRNQLAAKEKEVVQLVEDVQKANKNLQENEIRFEKKSSDLENQNKLLTSELEDVKTALSAQSDYESVKKDLSIMKSLYFPSHSAEEEDSRPLEVLILERSKTLQNDNSMLRQDKERLFQELSETKAELSDSRQRLEKQTDLISQLEDHVEQLQSISTPFREEADGRTSSDMLAEALKVDTDLDRESPVMSVHSPSAGNDAALLPIVQVIISQWCPLSSGHNVSGSERKIKIEK